MDGDVKSRNSLAALAQRRRLSSDPPTMSRIGSLPPLAGDPAKAHQQLLQTSPPAAKTLNTSVLSVIIPTPCNYSSLRSDAASSRGGSPFHSSLSPLDRLLLEPNLVANDSPTGLLLQEIRKSRQSRKMSCEIASQSQPSSSSSVTNSISGPLSLRQMDEAKSFERSMVGPDLLETLEESDGQ